MLQLGWHILLISYDKWQAPLVFMSMARHLKNKNKRFAF